MKSRMKLLSLVVLVLVAFGGIFAARRLRPRTVDGLPLINPSRLRTAATHPMQYYVSLPSGWSKERTWPVVVAITGSGKTWQADADAFAAVRDAHHYPFIIVLPIVTTNGGRDLRHNRAYSYAPSVWDRVDREGRCTFDRDGLSAVIADVAKEYNGEEKVFLTGHSAGGHLAVSEALIHPELLRGAAFAAVNYLGRCVTAPTIEEKPDFVDPVVPPSISSSPARIDLPVRFFLGTADAYAKYLAPQRDNAIRDAGANGFGRVSSVAVEGANHNPMIPQVLANFDSLRNLR